MCFYSNQLNQLSPLAASARWGPSAWHRQSHPLLSGADRDLRSLWCAIDQYRNALDTENGDIMTPPCLACRASNPGSASVRDQKMYIMLHSLDTDFIDVALNFFVALENQN